MFQGPQVDGETVAALLQAAGLDPQVTIEPYMGISMVPGADEATVYVPEHQAGRARELIARTTYSRSRPERR